VTSATGRLVPVLACFQAILQACPYPLFLAYAHPGDQRAEQPEGALGLYLAGPLHPAARGSGLEASLQSRPHVGDHPYTRWITGNASSIVVMGNTSISIHGEYRRVSS